jgi:RNA polymerase sigma-70 factor (ECF subfamily)
MSAAMDLLFGRDTIRGCDVDLADSGPAMTEPEFEAFHRATVRSLRAYTVRVLGRATNADDIVQEAYLRVLRSKPQADSPQQLKAFLFRVATHLIVDHWRGQRLERGAPDTRERPSDDAANVPLRIDLERAFERLRPEERAIMWLAYVEGADHREIAAALGFRPASIKVMLHRIRRKLAGLLRPTETTQGDR